MSTATSSTATPVSQTVADCGRGSETHDEDEYRGSEEDDDWVSIENPDLVHPPNTDDEANVRIRSFQLDDFSVLARVGGGAFSQVYLVVHKATNEQYAMKMIQKVDAVQNNQVSDIITERNVLILARQHPFIVNLHCTFQNDRNVYFVMEHLHCTLEAELQSYAHDLSLEPQHRVLPSDLSRLYAAEIFIALSYLHSNDILYRDLKPQNILLDDNGHIRLSDFGLSKVLDTEEYARSVVGSPMYIAPEILTMTNYGRSADWWSYGILLHRIFTGVEPFRNKHPPEVFRRIVSEDVDLSKFGNLTGEQHDLLSRLLVKNPSKRITERDIKSHAYFRFMNWPAVYAKRTRVPKPRAMVTLDPMPPSSTAAFERTANEQLTSVMQKKFEDFSFSGRDSFSSSSQTSSLAGTSPVGTPSPSTTSPQSA